MNPLELLLSAMPVGDMVKDLVAYLPLIEQVFESVKQIRDDEARALSMNNITRGIQYAIQAGDTSQLEAAIRDHCSSTGCVVP